ncbi:MAG TPA: hypothetical protein VKZ63_08265 [Kofleriaceae bacterium]|nr:hypothetical protein [Kofleriaceae bacterium]
MPRRRLLAALVLLAAPACGGSAETGPAPAPGATSREPAGTADGPAPSPGGDGGSDGASDEAPGLPPKVVPAAALESQRVAGEKTILPDEADARAIQLAGKPVVGVVKLCLDETGAPFETRVLKSTGYPTYDQKITTEMKAWRYHPFRVHGAETRVCTAITFAHSPGSTQPTPEPIDPPTTAP